MAEIVPTRLELWLMAVGRAPSINGWDEGLSGTAQAMLLWLVRCGDSGLFPKADVFCDLLQISDSSYYRAKKSLKASGLVALSPAQYGRESYQLTMPSPPSEKQLAAWRHVNPLIQSQKSALEEPGVAPDCSPIPLDDAAPEPEPPAAKRGTPRAAKSEAKPRAKTGLSDDQRSWILASADNLDVYLRFGQAGIGKSMAECVTTGLKSAGIDWLAFGQANHDEPYIAEWKANHFAAYYWHMVSRHREKANIPLALPQWGRLAGEIKNLLQTTTHFNAYQHLYLLGNHFDLIQFQLGTFGQGKVLCESSINDKSIGQRIALIIQHGTAWLQAEYDRMHAATNQPAYRGGE
jgi:hypothetical protein